MSRNSSAPRAALTAIGLLCLAGCDYSVFKDHERGAPIRVYDEPENYRLPGFGNVLTSFQSGDRSVVVASAGPDSPVVFEQMWTGEHLSQEASTRCKRARDCPDAAGVGAVLIALPVWAGGTPQEKSGCVLSPGDPKAYVFCDSDSSTNQSWKLELGELTSAGTPRFSGAGLPAGHPLGVALLGAYAVSEHRMEPSHGRVFYQPDFQPPGQPSDTDEVPRLEELPLRDPTTGELFSAADDAGDLGYAVGAAQNRAGELVIVVSQPARERVIVATYDDRLPGSLQDKLRTRACIENRDTSTKGFGFGKRLLIGDADTDGMPDIFVGIDPTDPASRASGAQAIYVYDGELPPPSAALTECPPLRLHSRQPRCPAPLTNIDDTPYYGGARHVACEGSGFGAALALGDLNHDGYGDLLVGAPFAQVNDQTEAGAIWLFPSVDPSRMEPLQAGTGAGAHLGMAVTVLRTNDRDEPVAGAPGENRLFTFMCSHSEKQESTDSLCLPK